LHADCRTSRTVLAVVLYIFNLLTLYSCFLAALEDYHGSRDLETLTTFATENLVPTCSPADIDLCDDDQKLKIKKYQELGADELEKLVKEKELVQAKVKKDYSELVEGLHASFEGHHASYQEATEAKDAALEAIEKDYSELVEGLGASFEGLHASYQEATETMDDDLEAIKKSGLGLMKAVMANMGDDKKDEL